MHIRRSFRRARADDGAIYNSNFQEAPHTPPAVVPLSPPLRRCQRERAGAAEPEGDAAASAISPVPATCSTIQLESSQKELTDLSYFNISKGMAILGNAGKGLNESLRTVFKMIIGFILGCLLGISFQAVNTSNLGSPIQTKESRCSSPTYLNHTANSQNNSELHSDGALRFLVSQSPQGAERLPPGIVVPTSDLYLRRLWGEPSEDLHVRQKYLVAFTVGYEQKRNIDAVVRKFSNNFTVVLFHYDGRTTEWDEFEWSKQAIHISARKQTKWWYAKRFLHPDIVAQYEYIFIWDEDLGVEHFNAEEYLKMAKKYGLEISQPSVESTKQLQWPITKRIKECEVHKTIEDIRKGCSDPYFPPCAAFVEIMAPVFSRNAWRCVWHMIQNDLVHGWGLDFALWRCVEKPAHEKIGVVDSQWIVHQAIPSLGKQGEAKKGSNPRKEVYMRCEKEWKIFQNRVTNAEKTYYKEELRSANYFPQA